MKARKKKSKRAAKKPSRPVKVSVGYWLTVYGGHRSDPTPTGRQGDDLARALHVHNGNLAKAMRQWSEQLAAISEVCLRVGNALGGERIEVTAEGCLICFHPKGIGARERLEILVRSGLIERVETLVLP